VTTSVDREIGRLSAEVASLQKQVSEQGVLIREMRDVIVQTRGSWKVLVAVAGLAATISGLVVSATQWWPWRGS
jgi:phosphoribosylcarboxyaminoimidazole (NCAIR) mutase